MLDHRTAVDVGERLSGESGRGESSGDDGDDVERRRGIDRSTSRCRGARRIIARSSKRRATIRGIAQMNWKRTATLGVVGGTLVTLVGRERRRQLMRRRAIAARAASSRPATRRRCSPEIARLHERLSAPIAPTAPARNLFRIQLDSSASAREPVARRRSAAGADQSMPQPPALTLVGLAEEAGPRRADPTAIISGVGGLHFVKRRRARSSAATASTAISPTILSR